MRKIVFIVIFSVCIIGCNKNTQNITFSQNEIIFWKYNESLTFDMLNKNLEDVLKYFESYVIIPLDVFEYYFWDENILSMKYEIYENYRENIRELYMDSDKGSIFFSIIVNNKIVFNGLNRIMPIPAQMQAYDGLGIPFINSHISNNKKNVYFSITYFDFFHRSIYDYFNESNRINRLGVHMDLDALFVKEIYDYFYNNDKIINGKFNISNLVYYDILEYKF
ncbi:MAG: hypothetical protein FWD28_09175 [Treponema sp.]|nr:hypothetical protein [Treponema sp.]